MLAAERVIVVNLRLNFVVTRILVLKSLKNRHI